MKKTNMVLFIVGGQAYPPSSSGAASILFNLLQGLDPVNIEVLTGEVLKPNSNFLPFKITRIPHPQISHDRWLWRLQVLEDILRYIQVGCRLTTAKRYDGLLLVFPDTGSFLAGYFIARLKKIKYQVYLIDLLADSRLNKLEWWLLRIYERKILEKAETVYCLNQGILEFYQSSVNREYALLPHCITLGSKSEEVIKNKDSKRKVIAFSGQIHNISLDALQNLIKAVRLIDEFDITVQIYTNRPRSYLQEQGLLEDFVEVGFISESDELLKKLQQADILFSPVVFEPRYPNQAMTCFPTKTFDYIQARKPILVHAPKNYFYTRYMTAHQAAFCATDFDPVTLKNCILEMLRDKKFQDRLVGNALVMVEKYHTMSEIQNRFVLNLFSGYDDDQ